MGKFLRVLPSTACLKIVLMLFNITFWPIGILLLYAGIWIRTQLQDYVEMNTEGGKAALLALACFGAGIALIATLAGCCTARGHPALLYLYGAFLAVVTLLEIGAGASIYAYRNSLTEGFDQALNESLAVYGKNHSKSVHVDTIQSTLHCCGNRDYTDWATLTPPKEIPKSCCKVLNDQCDTLNVNDIYTQGCYNRVVDFINSNISLTAACAVAIAGFPLVGVFLSCCLASSINKAKYEQVA
ncbi:tetraspanin-6 [Orussus abietinus]|uniref:tetraspanin-6 n=1 Tax=Orussus abietinus TaxID=222816 RepID=UPI0006265A18|nr:tetraspanin-6 [Orussus abietinus]